MSRKYFGTVGGAVYIGLMSVLQFHLFVGLWRRFADPVAEFFRGVFS